MSVMATGRVLTRKDLDSLPDDGLRHELIDGAFVMTPAPGFEHQSFVGALYRALHAASAGTDLVVILAPFDVVLGPHVVEPDILVAPRSAFTSRDLRMAPLIVVEVRSPATARLDEGRKRDLYEEAGVPHYWLADPQTPAVTILELVDGHYRQTASVTGNDTLRIHRPVPLSITPTTLARG